MSRTVRTKRKKNGIRTGKLFIINKLENTSFEEIKASHTLYNLPDIIKMLPSLFSFEEPFHVPNAPLKYYHM